MMTKCFFFFFTEWVTCGARSVQKYAVSEPDTKTATEQGYTCTDKRLWNGAMTICLVQTMWLICRGFLEAMTVYVVLSTEVCCRTVYAVLRESWHIPYCGMRPSFLAVVLTLPPERGPCSVNSVFVVSENTAKLKPVSKWTSFWWRERSLSLPFALFWRSIPQKYGG